MPIFGSKEKTTKERVEELLLSLHNSVRGINFVLLFRRDGLLVSSYPPSERVEGFGGHATAIIESVENLSKKFGIGGVKYILTSGETGSFVIIKGSKLGLAIVGEKTMNLGFVLTESERVLKGCEEVLG